MPMIIATDSQGNTVSTEIQVRPAGWENPYDFRRHAVSDQTSTAGQMLQTGQLAYELGADAMLGAVFAMPDIWFEQVLKHRQHRRNGKGKAL